MKAVILAAGEGTRLRPLTERVPKPLVPIANIPLLVRTIKLLQLQGVTQIGMNLYHHADQVIALLGTGESLGVSLYYSSETTLMGTAGGLKHLAETTHFLDETFLVLYGDNLYDFEIAPLLEKHKKHQENWEKHQSSKAIATLATFTTENPTACGLIATDDTGRVTRFQEKPTLAEVFTDQANAGVYVFEPRILDFIPPDTLCDFGKDTFPHLLSSQSESIFATPLKGHLCDTGTLPSYRQANWETMGTETLLLGENVQIAPDVQFLGRNIIGANTIIESGAVLTDTICWDDCHIGANACLTQTIIARGVRVAPHTVCQDDVRI